MKQCRPLPAVARLLVHFREEWPSSEAHEELDWMVISSLPPLLIERGNLTLRQWYHAVRRRLSAVHYGYEWVGTVKVEVEAGVLGHG
tara:strand:+ start:5661 stop:5921 length:261 start_codon:yes stop_codon:yes gene_type:complete